MPLDNVVPIDAEAARLLHRRNLRFRWFVAGLAAAWLSILVPVLVFTPLPPVGLFVVLAVLVVLAEHRFVLFGDETSMSASIVVVVASVSLFADSSPLAGPMLIASLGGLYLPHLVHRRSTLVLANASALGLAAIVAATLASRVVRSVQPSQMGLVINSIVCVGSYWCVNSVLIGCASALRNGTDLWTAIRDQVASEWAVLLLAISAALAAQAAKGSPIPVAMLSVAVPLIAFECEVRGLRRVTRQWASRSPSLRLAVLVGLATGFAIQVGGSSAVALLAMGGYFGVTFSRAVSRPSRWFLGSLVSVGVALAALNFVGLPAAVVVVLATFAVFSTTGPLHRVMTSNAYFKVGAETALPCLIAVGLFALGVLRTMDTPHLSVALGVVSPTLRNIAALAAVSTVGFAGRVDFAPSIVAVTIFFIGSAALRSVSARRSSQTASR